MSSIQPGDLCTTGQGVLVMVNPNALPGRLYASVRDADGREFYVKSYLLKPVS